MAKFQVGDYVVDTEADHDKKLIVVGIPGATADEWTAYETGDGEVTVAEDNPDYPEDALVVTACYLDDERHEKSITDDVDLDEWTDEDGDTLFQRVIDSGVVFYAFPEGRLEAVDDTDETATAHDEGVKEDTETNVSDGTDADNTEDSTTDLETLERIRDELDRLGWSDVRVDEDAGVVVVEKFGEHRVHPDGTVESDRETIREKLETAVDGVV
jgi:hypothetical protein